MAIYLLLILPALLVAPWGLQLGWGRILFVWLATTALTAWLIQIGSRDFPIYLQNFDEISNLPYQNLPWQDPLYSLSIRIWADIGGDGAFFYIMLASTALLLKLIAFRRLANYGMIATLLYLCSYFLLHEFTQTRAALAIALWMHAIIALPHSRRRFFLLTLIASAIHIQALLGLVAVALAWMIRRSWGRNILVGGTMVIMLLSPTRIFDQIGFALISRIPDARAGIYLALAEQESWARPNPFSIISLLAFATAAAGLLRIRPFDARPMRAEQQLAYACLLVGCASLSLLPSVTVAAFRVSEHFFSLLPVALANLVWQSRIRSILLAAVAPLAALMAYVFLFHSPTLLDPQTGSPAESKGA